MDCPVPESDLTFLNEPLQGLKDATCISEPPQNTDISIRVAMYIKQILNTSTLRNLIFKTQTRNNDNLLWK